MRLHRRLTFAMAVLLVIGLAVADIVTYTSLRSFLYGRLDSELASAQTGAVRYLLYVDRRGTPPTAEGIADRINTDVYVMVLGRTGSVITARPSGTTPRRPNPPPVVPRSVRLSPEIGPARGPYRPNPYNFTLAGKGGTSYRADAARVPQGTVIVAVELTQTNSTMTSLVRIEAGVSAAVLLALCVLALWTVRRGLRPLDDMAKTAGEIASGADLGRRIEPADEETEVGRLGSALNTMLGRIEEAFAEKSDSEARLRQFVADASHELRTPLTSIRGYAELLGKGGFADDDERKRALRRVEHEASRMSGLVDDLLLLARLDQGRPLDRAPVDLRRVCRDALDDAQLTAPDRSVELVAPDAVIVSGDRDRLAQVAHNLVRNAIVHTPAGTPVRLEVTAENGMGVLRVVDEGPGLTAERRVRVFDRFFRADRSRTGSGTGLGLAIVRAITEALDGRAWVQPRTDREGTVFGVEVPLDPGAAPSPRAAGLATAAAPDGHDDPEPEPPHEPEPALRGGRLPPATTRRAPGGA
jgi:two-component system OmpR family sensor kinase